MPDQNLQDYFNRRRSSMTSERSTFLPHYRELSEFIQPRRGRFFVTDSNKGDKRYNKIINSRATQAHRIARSGLLAGVMSPARPWFAYATPDPEMMEYTPVKIWLSKAENITRAIFNGGNLYPMASTLIGELLNFATGCMSHVDDFDDVARFYTHTVGSYMIAQDDKFKVNTLCRETQYTVSQLVEWFGLENVSTTVRSMYDRGGYDNWIPVVHFVEKNPKWDRSSPFSQNNKYRSVYYEMGSNEKDKMLENKGFSEFPVYCPRWDVTGEDIYGTDCPAMTALGDIKGLQVEERRKAQAIDKMVNPPLKGPGTLRNIQVSSLPGGITLYDYDGGKEGLSPIYTVTPDLSGLMADINKVEERINNAFFVNLFRAISDMEGIQPRNQLDIMQRNEERLLELGPVLEHIHGEFLNPLIDRTFNQALRADLFPPPPPELQGQPLRIEYISTLAMAQRAVAAKGIERLVGFVTGLVGAGFPQVVDKIDADQAIDEYSQVTGVPPRIIVSDDNVVKVREQRAKQQQAASMLQMAQAGADVAKTATEAKLSDPSVLSSAVKALQGNQ